MSPQTYKLHFPSKPNQVIKESKSLQSEHFSSHIRVAHSQNNGTKNFTKRRSQKAGVPHSLATRRRIERAGVACLFNHTIRSCQLSNTSL